MGLFKRLFQDKKGRYADKAVLKEIGDHDILYAFHGCSTQSPLVLTAIIGKEPDGVLIFEGDIWIGERVARDFSFQSRDGITQERAVDKARYFVKQIGKRLEMEVVEIPILASGYNALEKIKESMEKLQAEGHHAFSLVTYGGEDAVVN